MTAAAARSRSNEGTARPRARRRISSSSDMPVPKRSVRPQSPPIERAAISSTTGSSPARGRAQPQLAVHRAVREAERAGGGRGRLRSRGPGWPRAAATGSRRWSPRRRGRRADRACRRAPGCGGRPSSSRPSSATSAPGTKPSTRIVSVPSPSSATSAARRISRIRSKAATNWVASFARITPRLAESTSGLSTHGYVMRPAAARGSSSTATVVNGGEGTPARASRPRITSLLRVAWAAASGFTRRPRRLADRGGHHGGGVVHRHHRVERPARPRSRASRAPPRPDRRTAG